jgi:putative ABC transport system permease protein
MVENAVITGAGVAAGTVLTFAMNWWLAAHYDLPRLQGDWVPLGILVLVVLGQLAVLGPARRASLVSPAVATRTV